MVTKDQLCQTMIDRFEEEEGHPPADNDILGSSTLAVSMEHLGLLVSEEMQEYAASRGGSFVMPVTKGKEIWNMSFRELLSLLPD